MRVLSTFRYATESVMSSGATSGCAFWILSDMLDPIQKPRVLIHPPQTSQSDIVKARRSRDRRTWHRRTVMPNATATNVYCSTCDHVRAWVAFP